MGFQKGEYCLIGPEENNMSKPSYVIAIANAEKLAVSITQQIKNKTSQVIYEDVILQCLAEIHNHENFISWHKAFIHNNEYTLKRGVIFRGKFVRWLDKDIEDTVINMYQEHEAGYVIKQNNNDDYLYVGFSGGELPQTKPVGFVINDLSEFCQSLKSVLRKQNIKIGHVQLMNILAKYDGHQNFQSFKHYYESTISILDLPSYSGATERMKWTFNDCETLADCAVELIKKIDYLQRLQANNYEIVDNEDDYYTINYLGKLSDIMTLPKKPVTFSGSNLIRHMEKLNGLNVCRSGVVDCINEIITLNDLDINEEKIVADFTAHYPNKKGSDIALYLMHHVEPSLLAKKLDEIDMLEFGKLKVEGDKLRFIHESGCKYCGEDEIAANNFYILDVAQFNADLYDAVKYNDSALDDLMFAVLDILEDKLGISAF